MAISIVIFENHTAAIQQQQTQQDQLNPKSKHCGKIGKEAQKVAIALSHLVPTREGLNKVAKSVVFKWLEKNSVLGESEALQLVKDYVINTSPASVSFVGLLKVQKQPEPIKQLITSCYFTVPYTMALENIAKALVALGMSAEEALEVEHSEATGCYITH